MWATGERALESSAPDPQAARTQPRRVSRLVELRRGRRPQPPQQRGPAGPPRRQQRSTPPPPCCLLRRTAVWNVRCATTEPRRGVFRPAMTAPAACLLALLAQPVVGDLLLGEASPVTQHTDVCCTARTVSDCNQEIDDDFRARVKSMLGKPPTSVRHHLRGELRPCNERLLLCRGSYDVREGGLVQQHCGRCRIHRMIAKAGAGEAFAECFDRHRTGTGSAALVPSAPH